MYLTNGIKQYTITDLLGNVLTMLRGDLVVQSSVDVVQVSQHALRQLDNLLVPVRLRHLKQCWIEDRQNDHDVVTDHCRNVLIRPEWQHSLGDLTTISPSPSQSPCYRKKSLQSLLSELRHWLACIGKNILVCKNPTHAIPRVFIKWPWKTRWEKAT